MTAHLDFENLPDQASVEAIINDFGSEDTLIHINRFRGMMTENPNFEATDEQNRAGILLVRRLRSLRENSTKSKVSKAAPVALEESLADILKL